MGRSKRNALRITFVILGCCCIIAAAALSLHNRQEDAQAAEKADKLVESLRDLLVSQEPAEEPAEQVDPGIAQPPPEDAEESADQVRSVSVGNYPVCGVISLPTIQVELAVISEWSYPNLNISACRYLGAPEGQMIIMAHNYRSHFSRLSEMALGDEVTFTDVDGTVHRYTVSKLETLGQDQTWEAISGDDWDLTLFTCTYTRVSRIIVRCSRSEA